jgi:hypothetical protein
MANHHRPSVSSTFSFSTLARIPVRKALALFTTLTFAAACIAQDSGQPQPTQESQTQNSQTQQPQLKAEASAKPHAATETIPAGTRFALVLTHPLQSRYIHRGDDIYAQLTAPITLGNEVAIPPGTLFDGKVDKLQRKGGRAELYLQSMSMTFPDGYVVPVLGPAVLETVQGYAITDPGAKRTVGVFALPMAGAGLGALIGHSVGKADSQVTSAFPPGCIGGPPFCTTVNTPVFGTKAKDAIIGAGIGSAIGVVMSMTLLFSSHHFFLDVGSPVDLVLSQPISLEQRQVEDAVRESEEHPVAQQPIAPRPMPPAVPDNPDHGTCYTPGTPGTPDTIIPGMPATADSPGTPDTVIPGIPATPPTPYPCP